MRRPALRVQTGYTLMEVLVVVIILAVLATIAVPQYQKSVEISYRREADDLLQTIYHGERAYFFTNDTYINAATGNKWDEIYMDNPNLGSIPVTFDFTQATATKFKARAKRTGGGPCNNKVLIMNEQRTLSGNWQTCP